MRVEVSWVASLSSAILVFFVSLYVVPYYVLGDQEFYIDAYYGVADLGLVDAFSYYKGRINSVEYLHFLSVWVFSRFLDKTVYVSALNFFLALLGGRVFIAWGARWYIAVFIVVTNFYFWVMYIPAERLKLAFIVFFLALLMRAWVSKLFFLFLSLITHASILMMLVIYSVSNYLFRDGRIRLNWRLLVVGLLAILGSALVFDQLYAKVYGYYHNYRAAGMGMYYKTLLFFLLSLLYARVRLEVCVCYSFLMLAIFFVGDGRVNMFSYFVFLYFSLHFRGGVNFGVLLTSFYFLYSSFNFFDMTISYGTTNYEQIQGL